MSHSAPISSLSAAPSAAATAARIEAPGIPWAGLILAATLATLAGLVWLGLSSRLAATGREIAHLDNTRQVLLERRVAALSLHAANSHPRRLAERAEALGFAPVTASRLERLPVAEPLLLARDAKADSTSPLSIARRAGALDDYSPAPADVSTVLMSLGAAEPASANELEAGTER